MGALRHRIRRERVNPRERQQQRDGGVGFHAEGGSLYTGGLPGDDLLHALDVVHRRIPVHRADRRAGAGGGRQGIARRPQQQRHRALGILHAGYIRGGLRLAGEPVRDVSGDTGDG